MQWTLLAIINRALIFLRRLRHRVCAWHRRRPLALRNGQVAWQPPDGVMTVNNGSTLSVSPGVRGWRRRGHPHLEWTPRDVVRCRDVEPETVALFV